MGKEDSDMFPFEKRGYLFESVPVLVAKEGASDIAAKSTHMRSRSSSREAMVNLGVSSVVFGVSAPLYPPGLYTVTAPMRFPGLMSLFNRSPMTKIVGTDSD